LSRESKEKGEVQGREQKWHKVKGLFANTEQISLQGQSTCNNKTSFHSRQIDATDFVGEKALATGWGRPIPYIAELTPVLKGAILSVISNLDCIQKIPFVSIKTLII
jgi:hypothetical protein